MLAAGQWLQGRYRIIHALGQGGMAQVYLAADSRLADHPVAVKVMFAGGFSTAEFGARWRLAQAEAQLLARLNHPGVASVIDCFAEGDLACLVMEYVPGETLADRLARAPARRLPPDEALALMRALGDVLGYLHSRQPPVIFRDLKPANIILTPEGHLKLVDFGIARFFKPGQTHDTEAFGTPGYAAPEQYGSGQTVPQSDIYSLGIVLHEMLTGEEPATRVPFLPLTPPSRMGVAVPPAVDAAIARATDLAIANRFADAAGFVAALSPPQPEGSHLSRWVVAALLVVMLLAAGGLGLRAWDARQGVAMAIEATGIAPATGRAIVVEVTAAPTEPTPSPRPTNTVAPTPTDILPTATASRLDLPGDGIVAMTNDAANEYAPNLSPDQRELVYMSDAGDGWQLVAQDTTTGATRTLTDNGANNFIPSYSPDGARIIFASDVGGDFDLYTIDRDGGPLMQLLDQPGDDVYPSYSPGGEYVLFMSTSGAGGYGVFVLNVADGAVDTVIDGSARETFPVWAPDGRTIVYQSNEPGNHDIYALADGETRQLTFDGGRDAAPVVSPDGQWVVFESSRNGQYDLYAVPIGGGTERRLTDYAGDDQVPRFSPDGKWLLYQSHRDGSVNAVRQPFTLD